MRPATPISAMTVIVLAGCLTGCEDFQKALETEREPVTPPGIASPEDVAGDNAKGNAGKPAPKADGQPRKRDKSSIIGKVAAKVVDKKRAMAENPNLVEVGNEIKATDPVTLAGSAYVSAVSQISMAQFKHNLDIWKNLPGNEGRNPTYKEFTEMAKDLRFARLPRYQMYGYDSQTGTLVILEDRAMKKRIYEEAGIPLEE